MKYYAFTFAVALASASLSCGALAKGGGAHGGSHSDGAHSGHGSGKAATGTGSSGSSHAVGGHVTKSGAYVAPHRATDPNGTKRDNYSTKGNVNPHTGKEGTK